MFPVVKELLTTSLNGILFNSKCHVDIKKRGQTHGNGCNFASLISGGRAGTLSNAQMYTTISGEIRLRIQTKGCVNLALCIGPEQASTGWSIWSDSWVGLTLICDVPPSCPPAQPVLAISHQPKQNLAEGGTAKIKANPATQEDGPPCSAIPSLKHETFEGFISESDKS